MELTLNGIAISVPTAAIEQLVRERLAGGAVQTSTHAGQPAIGAAYQGGIYAGLTIFDEEPHQLVLLPDEVENVDWKAALAWAEQRDAVLPSRFDQLVLFKNLKSEFKPEWYWSGEQHASDAGYAWYQYFGSGVQDDFNVDTPLRARAVRRIPFSNLAL